MCTLVLSLWILKHTGNLHKKLLPCMRTKQSAAGGGRTVAKTCGTTFAGGGRGSHPQAVVGSGRRAADSRETLQIYRLEGSSKALGRSLEPLGKVLGCWEKLLGRVCSPWCSSERLLDTLEHL